jgi:hypothetical protein
VSDVAVAARLSGVVPSPQLTDIEEIVPSGSAAVNVTVTVAPVFAMLGETVDTATMGGRSFTVSIVIPWPEPALLVAVTVIVNI